jgi:DNA-directed RNA polymerase specialized sigma24 family protein/uncharacterized membrane protein YgcG
VRSGRGQRDEFTQFYKAAYPELLAQVLAITGDANIAKAATKTTLAKAWRAWPTLRQAPNPLVRTRWSAVLVAAEHGSSDVQPVEAVQELTGEAGEDAVLVAAMQLLPPVQRRALVLHYMGGVSVNDLAALSGSSAQHIELLLDDGFTTLAEALDWADDDTSYDADDTAVDGSTSELDEASSPDDLDLRFDWTADALADAAARLPDGMTVPSAAAMLRRAALVRWSTRAVPVAAGAACIAVVVVVAQPGAATDYTRPAIYAQNDNGTGTGIDLPPLPAIVPDSSPPLADAPGPQAAPTVRLRSLALTSLLNPPATAQPSGGAGSSQGTSRAVSASSPSGGGTSSTGSSGSTSSTSGISGTSGATGSTGTTTTTSPGSTTTAPPSSTTTAPPSSTTVPTTQPTTETTVPVSTTTTDPTTQPVTTDPTPVDPTTTPPVIPSTTITTPTTVIEITTTTPTAVTTTDETTTADTTTPDSTTAEKTKADKTKAESDS